MPKTFALALLAWTVFGVIRSGAFHLGHWRIGAAAGATLAASLALTAGPAAAQTILRADTGAQVEPGAAGAALADGPLVLRIGPGEHVRLLTSDLTSPNGGLVYVAASSEFVTFAAVNGNLAVGRTLLRPGQAAVVVLRTGRTQSMDFDAARLAASAPPRMAEEFQASLTPIAARQSRLIFWGLLAPTGINARAPASPRIEAVRETYLMYPAILDLRARAGRDATALHRLTAERFVAALAAGDAATVASLIDPQPFLAAGAGWSDARLDYARQMAAGSLPTALAGATVAPAGADAFTVSGAAGSFDLAVVDRDGATFVTRLETR